MTAGSSHSSTSTKRAWRRRPRRSATPRPPIRSISSRPSRFADVVERVTSDLGPQSLLVNDAGVGVAATLLETSPEDWDRIIAINLTAMFHTCRAVLPGMLDAGHGVIVNVASIAGVVGIKNRLAYTASKHGVVGLTRAIAADYAHLGIRSNAICPGTVETEWIGKILADAPDPDATRKQMEAAPARRTDGNPGGGRRRHRVPRERRRAVRERRGLHDGRRRHSGVIRAADRAARLRAVPRRAPDSRLEGAGTTRSHRACFLLVSVRRGGFVPACGRYSHWSRAEPSIARATG